MTLEIQKFADPGDLDKERIVFKVIESLDLGMYVVLRSGAGDEGRPKSGSKSAYWFPDSAVNVGDLVVLYTKSGRSSKKVLNTEKTAHFYYWQQTVPFWGSDTATTAVLIKAETWTYKPPPKAVL